MQPLHYQIPNNPLKLLDDYLSSISTENVPINQGRAETDMLVDNPPDSTEQQDVAAPTTPSSSLQSPPTKHSAQAEHLHNSVLRVAAELFGNNISLLENSLALLEEQEQYKNNDDNDDNNTSSSSNVIPPIRTIRARRSGRVAVLVRKQRKKSRASHQQRQQQQQQSDKQIIDDYYLCLHGRDKVSIDNNNAFKTSKGTYLCNPHHRIGMHCTCRSFFHNIKGSSSSSGSGGGRFKSNGGERSPTGKASSSLSYNSISNNNSIVCKHLLAVILMPHLLPWREQGVEEDVVDDKLFTKLVMRASIG